MSQRTKRFSTLAKTLLASGVLGGGGYGGYTLIDSSAPTQADAQVAAATLDEAVEAWADGAPEVPSSNPLAALNQPPAGLPAAPPQEPAALPPAPAGNDRYAVSAPPLPPMGSEGPLAAAADDQPIARGQSPSYDDLEPDFPPAGLPEGNPLRPAPTTDNAGSAPAREAFADAGASDQIGPPPGAVAAFGAADQASGVVPVAAVEPIDDLPPTPLGLPPADTAQPVGGPLDALPQESEEMAPLSEPAPIGAAPFEQDLLDQPPTEPNPLRQPEQAPAGLPMADADSHSVLTARSAPQEEPLYSTPMPPQDAAYPAEPHTMTAPVDSLGGGLPADGAGRPGERALEGRQQPSLAIQKFAPAEIQVGKPCKFLIKVRNVGQRPAKQVVVRDQAPAGVQLTSTTPQAQSAGDELVWELGEMAPGEEKTLAIEMTPMEEGQIGSVATVSFAAEASVQTKCTRPQLAIRMTAPSQVLVGQEQQIQIEIKNPGTGDATGVMILENVPENLRHAAGPTLEFEVGTLRAGETRRLQLNMLAERPGKVVNVLTAQADGNLQVDQQVEFEVVAPALEVAVDGPAKRFLERPATYTVKIGNPGTAPAHNLRLVTRLPRGMKFVKANNLGEYDATSHAVYWSLAELPSGESGAVELTTIPVAAGDQQLQIKGEAQNGLSDEAIHQTAVEGIAALKFTVLDLEDPIEVGGETEYEIRVANQGTKAATNVRVQAAAPAGMRIVSAAGDARHRIQAGGVQFEPIRQLAPRAEMTFKVRVQGAQPGDHRLVVEVASDDLAQPVRKEESTRVFGDE
ncbi:Large cysteine-rich periplasmic protein OmcB precursor [Posidoniimonas corsicana]|uniref:Large cysteine-rich periplasmic protein OmcB n=1 Tax=Posidoniimonas corsicana TaxID=1938618 RepID=A0A5C5VEX8_9BACT|nr:CARDB domain-containing protein [Posidoniimonas corsicana]TWT37198.1 Large cysteine-rich periplasmic protein OmcB precursor [Posidoniimonas corsicana]